MSWLPQIDWETPAGRTLETLFSALPVDSEFHLTLFGSSPLQLGIEPAFVSNDVDLFCDRARGEVEDAVARAGLRKGEKPVYIEVCTQSNFRTSPRWFSRAFTTQIGRISLTLPHPLDILIAKLHRLDEKDLRAYRLVIDRTGHPTEEEMREELQFAVDLYRPNFDEEMVGDITTNTRVLWNEIWKRDINVRQEIIAPALAARRRDDEAHTTREDYKAELRRLAAS